VFLALHLAPGDPAQMLLSESNATAAQIAERRTELGLDDACCTATWAVRSLPAGR